jgi:uncharacterized protein YggE
VSNQLNVTVRDIDKVGDVLAQAAAAGANSIYGVSFNVADPATFEAAAREQAVADARERAQSLAELSGKTLGDVVSITEVIGSVPVPLYNRNMGNAAAESGVTVSAGTLTFTTSVQVTFELK